jgi:hypothetical protein
MNKNRLTASYAVALLLIGGAVGYSVPHLATLFADKGGEVGPLTAACDAAIKSGICENRNKCTVTVPVTACGVMPDVDPPTLHVCDHANITWQLSTPASGPLSNAKFASDTGIAFSTSDGGADQFSKVKVRDKLFEHFDKHTKNSPPDSGGFKYSIHILTADQPNCINYDPRVSNE